MEKNFLSNKTINLTSVLNGASIIGCNNEHFGRAENIIAPGKGKNMGDGWETRRSRGKNFDWLIIKFGKPGLIKKLEIDTHHFKGNYPATFSLQGSFVSKNSDVKKLINNSAKWKTLITKTKLKPHDNLKISKVPIKELNKQQKIIVANAKREDDIRKKLLE